MSGSNRSERYRAYAKAGVDIRAGNALVSRIKDIAARTRTHGTLSDIGSFGGLFKPDIENFASPVLIACADGVGTKLKLAVACSKHYGVGIDLVAMNVNDIIVHGAKPLFFLDYFATGNLDAEVVATVIEGIADGCKQAGCVLLGGETAEMPDMYNPGDYDLAGFCVGIADDSRIVDGSSIKVGDSVIGVYSSGPHSNGFALIRKILDNSGLRGSDLFPGSDKTVGDVLLAPTIIYAECIRNLMRDFSPSGMAHITGGGFYDNIPRILPKQVKAVIDFGSWDIPPVFHWLKREGDLEWTEMLQIFNCGIGFVIIAPREAAEEITGRIEALQFGCREIGSIERCKDKENEQVEIHF
jgi:phosphoribosylformylglycinamidine cyclo-ligase